MPRMQLSLATLKDFDAGKAAVAFQKALERVVLDCLDRPGDNNARTVTLTTTVTPVLLQDGDVVDAEVDFKVKAALPPWKTAPRPLKATRQGHLFFQELAPDNPDQSTIDDPIEAARRENEDYARDHDTDD